MCQPIPKAQVNKINQIAEILDGKEIPRNTRNFIKRFEEMKAERLKNLDKPVAAKPAASMRATKSMLPTLDIVMSDEAILFQSWNQRKY